MKLNEIIETVLLNRTNWAWIRPSSWMGTKKALYIEGDKIFLVPPSKNPDLLEMSILMEDWEFVDIMTLLDEYNGNQ